MHASLAAYGVVRVETVAVRRVGAAMDKTAMAGQQRILVTFAWLLSSFLAPHPMDRRGSTNGGPFARLPFFLTENDAPRTVTQSAADPG